MQIHHLASIGIEVLVWYRPSAEGADPPLVLTGEYCCMIPDMSGVTQRLYVNVTLDGGL